MAYVQMHSEKKIELDTSCIFDYLIPSLDPYVAKQLPSQGDKRYRGFTSRYLRMEFLRRWILIGIEIYSKASLLGTINQALNFKSESFSVREVKATLKWAAYIDGKFVSDKPEDRIHRLGWEVYILANSYDNLFKIQGVRTKCKRGEVKIDINQETLSTTLEEFYERFSTYEAKCDLRHIIISHDYQSQLAPIIKAKPQEYPQKSRKPLKTILQFVQAWKSQGYVPDCTDCWKIGDLLVLLEQYRKTTLYHSDHVFCALCPIMKHEHIHIKKAPRS